MLLTDRSPTPMREKSLKFTSNEVVPFGKNDPVASLLHQSGDAFPPTPPWSKTTQDQLPDPARSSQPKPNGRQRKKQRFSNFKQSFSWGHASKGKGKNKEKGKAKSKSGKAPGKVKGHKK
jgi:hypothetical protein